MMNYPHLQLPNEIIKEILKIHLITICVISTIKKQQKSQKIIMSILEDFVCKKQLKNKKTLIGSFG